MINLFVTDRLTVDDIKAVRTEIWEARSDWLDIGIELGLKVADLDAIKENNHGNVEKCFSKMLIQWLRRTNPPPTWSAMVEALKQPAVGFKHLADQVESKFLVDDHEPKQKIRRTGSGPEAGTIMSSEYMASDTTDSGPATGTTGEYCGYVSCNKN